MVKAQDRSRTPTPAAWPLTPPPTGGFKDVADPAFLEEHDRHYKHAKHVREGESITEFFEDSLDGFLGEGESLETEETNSDSIGTLKTLTPEPKTPTIARYLDVTNDSLVSAYKELQATNLVEPFPFLDLPLSVRNEIYGRLLVIPAIICIRQKHTAFHEEKKAFLYAERRELLPGIAYALGQVTVDGFKARFSRFVGTNINILRANKEIFAEAKSILYGNNVFEIVKPSDELSPPPDFSIRLFPSGCQRLVTKMIIRIHSFYDLEWLLNGGFNQMKNFYRGLNTLTLVLELQSAAKGFGRMWARKDSEHWVKYVLRMRDQMILDMCSKKMARKPKAMVVPVWVDLRVMFTGDSYYERLIEVAENTGNKDPQSFKRNELRQALCEAWELFKKGGCCDGWLLST